MLTKIAKVVMAAALAIGAISPGFAVERKTTKKTRDVSTDVQGTQHRSTGTQHRSTNSNRARRTGDQVPAASRDPSKPYPYGPYPDRPYGDPGRW
jgi:hypothetical protein